MVEEGKGVGSELKRTTERIKHGLHFSINEKLLRLDKDAKKAKELFEQLAPALGFLTEPDNFPSTLEVKADGKEFVGIRRFDAGRIERLFVEKSKPLGEENFQTIFTASIPTDTLDEGQILLFIRPDPIDYSCNKPEVERRVIEMTDDNSGFTYLAMMSKFPELFNKEDWDLSSMKIALVAKLGGKFYKTDLVTIIEPDGNRALSGSIGRLKPNKDSKIEFEYASHFMSPEDLTFNKENLSKWSRMFILNEGSSEKEKESMSSALNKLKLSKPLRIQN